MWNFKKLFDFNSKPLREALELDDEQPELPVFKSTVDKSGKFDMSAFRVFINVNILNTLGIDLEKIGDNYIGYKEYTDDSNNTHFICYIKYYTGLRTFSGYEEVFKWYFDYQPDSKVLTLGNVNGYRMAKWFNISYPLIKIISEYNGPVYVGEVHIEEGRHALSALEALDANTATASRAGVRDGIALPLNFMDITESASFFRTTWNNQKYFLPYDNDYIKIRKSWPTTLMIPHSFVENIQGILSNHANDKSITANLNDPDKIEDKFYTAIYREMFESTEDFNKIVEILCKAGFPVVDKSTLTKYTIANYQELLGSLEEPDEDDSNYEEELEYRSKLSDLLGEPTMEYYDTIIQKNGNLYVRDLFNERASAKDLYRKFNDNVVKKILMDNGVSIDKIIQDSHDRVMNLYKEFADVIVKSNNKDFSANLYALKCNRRYIKKELLADNPELIDVIFKIKNEVALITEDDAKEILNYFDKISGSSYNDTYMLTYTHNNNVVLEFYALKLLYARFYYLLNKKCCKYELDKLESMKNYAGRDIEINNLKLTLDQDGYLILGTLYNRSKRVSYYVSTEPTPFNLGNINFSINTYESLYKFCYFIAYAVENGYSNLEVLNFMNAVDDEYNRGDETIDVDQYFTDDLPNMNTFNSDALAKCLNTIFNNMANRLKKK